MEPQRCIRCGGDVFPPTEKSRCSSCSSNGTFHIGENKQRRKDVLEARTQKRDNLGNPIKCPICGGPLWTDTHTYCSDICESLKITEEKEAYYASTDYRRKVSTDATYRAKAFKKEGDKYE